MDKLVHACRLNLSLTQCYTRPCTACIWMNLISLFFSRMSCSLSLLVLASETSLKIFRTDDGRYNWYNHRCDVRRCHANFSSRSQVSLLFWLALSWNDGPLTCVVLWRRRTYIVVLFHITASFSIFLSLSHPLPLYVSISLRAIPFVEYQYIGL